MICTGKKAKVRNYITGSQVWKKSVSRCVRGRPGVKNGDEEVNIYRWESKGKELNHCGSQVWKK